jgi:hypothetical protein
MLAARVVSAVAVGLWGRARAAVLGEEVGMLPHTIARALDLDDDGVVKQPVE